MKFFLEVRLKRTGGLETTYGSSVDTETEIFQLYWPFLPSAVRARAEEHANGLVNKIRERLQRLGGYTFLSACLYEDQGSWLFGLKTYR